MPRPEPVANYHCHTGENPLWDDERQVVYWTDIPKGRLFRYDARTGEHRQIYSGEPVGGFTLQKDGSLLLFQVNKFSLMRPDGGTRILVEGIDDDMVRFNDVIADPRGRVYAGTIGKNSRSGGLYLIATDGGVTCLFKGTGCSNGMGFSPNRKHLYWTCSSSRKVFRFDYQPATGELTKRHELICIGADEGVPDGLTVDSEGNLWSARWDGSAIHKYSPSGKQIGRIDFPVAKVSSMIFGGPDLDELYVTTAGGSDDDDTPDGSLYRVKVAARGLREFRSDVRKG
ncbi:MAG TPA: SMP-30/gluconolactonase/LRE family protein [Phycisphaerae bacterium]|nr:SMP-30/gluconolactonase/LRE family protein [Phycisphaerae bacterium]